MDGDKQLRDKLTTYIQDAYAMENQIVETLEKHAGQAKDFPDIQARIRQHLDATKEHRARMEDRLRAHGQSPSKVKGALTGLMGNMAGIASGVQADRLAMDARDEYVIEHLEIASYALLIATARACGDEDTVRAAEANLRDEVAMQRWLLEHLPQTALLSLRQDGVTIPRAAWQSASQTASRALGDAGLQA
jgi:ferritin-like metal-binding protein YciE